MHYTPEQIREMNARFVMAFLAECERRHLPLDADAAMEYSRTAWSVEFSVENYAARTST